MTTKRLPRTLQVSGRGCRPKTNRMRMAMILTTRLRGSAARLDKPLLKAHFDDQESKVDPDCTVPGQLCRTKICDATPTTGSSSEGQRRRYRFPTAQRIVLGGCANFQDCLAAVGDASEALLRVDGVGQSDLTVRATSKVSKGMYAGRGKQQMKASLM